MSDPIIWEIYGDYILSDITLTLEDKVKEFVVKNYIEKSTICNMIQYTDEENYVEDHGFYLNHIFGDQSSVVILNEKNDEIVAAAIMKTMTRAMRSWTAIRLVSKNRKLNSLLALTRKMILEADAQLNHPTGSMHIFEICRKQNGTENDSMDWIQILFHGAYRVAQSMKMPMVTFIGFSLSEQAAAIAADFTEVSRIFYPTYTEVDGSRPVPPSDVGEMYAVFYMKEVSPFIVYHELP